MSDMKKMLLSILIFAAFSAAGAERLVDELLESYGKIETLSCEVRRTSITDSGRMRSLSRVHYQRPDRIHVHSSSPIERRHVADGERIYYYVDGDPKGFSSSIEDLGEDWLTSLRQVPGTAMDHLLKIGDAAEDELPATDEYPVRRGYRTEKPYIVLSLDEQGRLSRVEYFENADLRDSILVGVYSRFVECLPGVWIPTRHRITLDMQGFSRQDNVQFLNIIANEPLSQGLFNPDAYFSGVEFVDNFEDIYK